jgi:hypothetical protein
MLGSLTLFGIFVFGGDNTDHRPDTRRVALRAQMKAHDARPVGSVVERGRLTYHAGYVGADRFDK